MFLGAFESLVVSASNAFNFIKKYLFFKKLEQILYLSVKKFMQFSSKKNISKKIKIFGFSKIWKCWDIFENLEISDFEKIVFQKKYFYRTF